VLKKKIVFMIVIMVICNIFSLRVYANGPVPPRHIECKILNIPDNIAFVDLLINISEQSNDYISYNETNGQRFLIGEQSQIVSYNTDSFQSFTFHFAESASDIIIDESAGGIKFGYQNDQFQKLLDEYPIVKIVLLDSDGKIVKISDSVNINPKKTGFFMGRITYDAANNIVDAPYYNSPFAFLFYIFTGISVLVRMCISSSVETLIAIPFKLKPLRKVFAINIITQAFLVVFMSFCKLPYMWSLLIAEAVVYFAEFKILGFFYKDISTRKLVLFVIAANTISLLLGLALNSYNIIA